MDKFDKLLQAKDESEFFILICSMIFPDSRYIPGREYRNAIIHTQISRAENLPEHGSGLKDIQAGPQRLHDSVGAKALPGSGL